MKSCFVFFTEALLYNGINFALTHWAITLNPRRLLLKILIPQSFYKCHAHLRRERNFGVFSVLHATYCAIKDKFLEWPKNTILIYVSYIARKLIMQIIIFNFTSSHVNEISEEFHNILGIKIVPDHLIHPYADLCILSHLVMAGIE